MLYKTFNKIYDTDIGYSFFNSKIAIISSTILFIIFLCSTFAGLVSPYNPFDPATVSLMDAFTPPSGLRVEAQVFFLERISKEEICSQQLSMVQGFH